MLKTSTEILVSMTLAAGLATLSLPAGATVLFSDNFDRPDGVIANEYMEPE